MDSKEIKNSLKCAKESLDQKDFKGAIKKCISILKSDRNNYLALVLYGAAIQETEQKYEAPKAFKKAIEISPDHLLAWRGLASYYEKNDGNADFKDLLNTYIKLLTLETDFEKISETIEKFEKLTISIKDFSKLKNLVEIVQNSDDVRRELFQKCLMNIIGSTENLPDEVILRCQRLLKDGVLKISNECTFLNFKKKILKVLFNQKNYESVLLEGSELLESFPNDLSILEYICNSYNNLSDNFCYKVSLDFSPEIAYSNLIQLSPNSYLGYLCKGNHELQCDNILNALDSFSMSVKFKPNSSMTWFKIGVCQSLLYRFSEAEESYIEALKYFDKTENENILKCEIRLLHSLCEQDDKEKWFKGKNLGEKLLKCLSNNTEILYSLIKILIKLGNHVEAKNYLNKLSENEKHTADLRYLYVLILKHEHKIEEFKANLEKLVLEFPDHFDGCLELGKVYFQENNIQSTLLSFLKSAKLNQWCYLNFLYLGHCYKSIADLEKARRCYQKAFQLNPSDVDVGISLSDLYRSLGKEELNISLLCTVTTINPRTKWAWLKLGLFYLSVNKHQEAVNCLQVVVRLDSNDKNAWECLGDAYFAQNAYTSALKSYQRVSEFDANCVYPKLQIAKIKNLLGNFNESVVDFRTVVEKFPDYIPVLKGHSEACLLLMRQFLSQNLDGLASDACQEAVNSLIRCLEIQKDLICIWKFLGDACALLTSLPEKYCKLEVASWLTTKSNNKNDKVILDKIQIFKLGSKSYCQAIALNPESFSLWYDLAFIYNQMVEVSKTKDSRKQMRELACSAIKKSILINENSWENWNFFGIILASKEIQDYVFAQHCFIKAIMKDNNNAITWTNLGTLYLELSDLPIANQSFTEAQKCDPDYVYCWVGQAIIAQLTGHHDAMDLFRHSTQLKYSTEGCLGYSNLVCDTLLNTENKLDKNYLYSIENMNAITVASDVLTRYTSRITSNSWAFNMLGLLLERQMLYGRSAVAFEQALGILRSEKMVEGNDNCDIIDKVLLNYSRVLSNLKKYDEAITYLKQIKKATFINQCEMAATYYRTKMFQEAYSSYETTLEWLAPDCEVKSHILVAMAAVVYLHQGQEDAKILLMQSCQLKPPSVQGLFALCALGILHLDISLSELTLKELNRYKNDIRYIGHIAVFEAYIYLMKGQKEKAVRALLKVIHKNPDQPSFWLNLSLLLLHLYPEFDSKSAARCAEVALKTGRSSIDVSKVMSLVSLSHLLSGDGLKSLRSSQKAVHMFPDVTENWVVLLASVLSKCLVQESAEKILWLKKMISYVRRKLESSKPMTVWLSNNDRKITMMAEKLSN